MCRMSGNMFHRTAGEPSTACWYHATVALLGHTSGGIWPPWHWCSCNLAEWRATAPSTRNTYYKLWVCNAGVWQLNSYTNWAGFSYELLCKQALYIRWNSRSNGRKRDLPFEVDVWLDKDFGRTTNFTHIPKTVTQIGRWSQPVQCTCKVQSAISQLLSSSYLLIDDKKISKVSDKPHFLKTVHSSQQQHSSGLKWMECTAMQVNNKRLDINWKHACM